ncbi:MULTISPECIES: acyltransferase family protein [Pacificibacter]|uniref:acyltransferase family protein n=1 Tax=Pacificibacter TaxID=1042323 RepID=UPI001C0A192A|nr:MULTISPECIES: acyltransferase [Pacificibacter]MBU2937398.1 acyltransferase [Pacificibacter marinus]MDO6617040.1 acyltransferase [Pacificibacter sp. 1_MG-2023]
MIKYWRLTPETNNLLTLDFLRFIASLGIVYYHLNEFFFSPEQRQDIIGLQGFGMFVDLFFMISGFVLTYAYLGRINSLSSYLKFLWRRVARLYPLHLVVLAINIGTWWILLLRANATTAPSFDPACILHTALLIQEYLNCGSPYTFNGVTWSISIEMGLYVLFPIFILLARSIWLLIGSVSVCFIISGVLLEHTDGWGHLPSVLRGLTGFTFGIFLFCIREHLPNMKDKGIVSVILVLLLIFEMLTPTSSWIRMVTIVALATTAVASDVHGNINGMIRRLAPFGQLTYSMYIWHRVIILVFMNAVADKMFHGNQAVLIAMTALSIAVIVVTSYAGYFLIETPARKALTNVTKSRNKK